MTASDDLMPIKALLRKLGRQTLEVVGPGQGVSGIRKYSAVFSEKLAQSLEEQMKSPVVVLMNYAAPIETGEDIAVIDKPFSLAIVAHINEQSGEAVKPPTLEDVQEARAIDYEDFKVINTEGLQTCVLMVLDITAKRSTPYIPKTVRKNLRTRAKRIKANLYGVVNLGYHTDIYFPPFSSMVDASKLAKKPETAEPLQGDFDKATGNQPTHNARPEKRIAECAPEIDLLRASLKPVINTEDISSLEE